MRNEINCLSTSAEGVYSFSCASGEVYACDDRSLYGVGETTELRWQYD